jgi:hypothetical protein
MNITYFECVSVALGIHHAMRMLRILLAPRAYLQIHIYQHYIINGTIKKKKKILYVKSVF